MQSDLVMGLFFGPGKFRRGLTDMQVIDDHIRTKETYAAFLVVIYFLLNTLSIAISLVPGAALGGGAAGVTFGALPRTVWTSRGW